MFAAIGVVAVCCWAIGVYGIGSHSATQAQMILRQTVFPVRGTCVSRTRVTARLADLRGDSGEYRGLLWARTTDGLTCRAPGPGFSVIVECRQEGDVVAVDGVVARGVWMFYLGLFGFMLALTTMLLGTGTPRGWWIVIPVGLLLVVALQGLVHLRRARADAGLLSRYVEAACAEAAAARST